VEYTGSSEDLAYPPSLGGATPDLRRWMVVTLAKQRSYIFSFIKAATNPINPALK